LPEEFEPKNEAKTERGRDSESIGSFLDSKSTLQTGRDNHREADAGVA